MSQKLNHTQLIEAVAEESGLPADTVTAVLRALFDVVGRVVTNHGRIAVTNFGTWYAAKSAPRLRRDPSTGEEYMDRAKWYPRFTWSPRVRNATVAGDVLPTLRKRGKGQVSGS